MSTEFVFKRMSPGGVLRYAKAVVSVAAGGDWGIVWNAERFSLLSEYSHFACAGASRALRAHLKQGGGPVTIRIDLLDGVEVDLTQDAIECAVEMATWMTLGGSTDDVEIRLAGDKWLIAYV